MNVGLKMPTSLMVLVILSLVFDHTRPASAGGAALCSDPFIFGGSDVNIVVMPYTLRAPDEQFRQETSIKDRHANQIAQKLSILIQLDTLYALSYPAGMAVVHIIPDVPDCRAEIVLKRVRPQLYDGKGIILLWGHFLEDGDQIYVQSYLRFLRRDQPENVEFRPSDAPDLRLIGGPAQQAIGFAPRLLKKLDITALDTAFEEAIKIYKYSNGNDVKTRLELTPERPLAYYVDNYDSGSGRMHIHPVDGFNGPQGWIAARADPNIWPLHQKLPELTFVNAVAGYLAARIIEEEKQDSFWAGPWEERLQTARETSQEHFADYRQTIEQDDDKRESFDERTAVALSFSLSGMLDLLAIHHAVEDSEKAERLSAATRQLTAARRLLPYQAETRNLLAMSLAGAVKRDSQAPARAVQTWSNALSLDPGSDEIANNLAQFYDFLLHGDSAASGLSEAELRARWISLTETLQPQQ